MADSVDDELKLSLAQWSIHRGLETGIYQPEDFPAIAKNEFGITAVEYVNRFYINHAADTKFWADLRASADALGVQSLLIMVDEAGELGSSDVTARNQAVENHYQWVDAARILGCHSIRVNAFGEGSRGEVQAAVVDALEQLCTYALPLSISILLENHGLFSSDGRWISEMIQRVNRPNCGTLPDFGNWCLATKWGSTEEGTECTQVYDRYAGVLEMLPFARGVSAKSYAFDERGNETTINYLRMLRLIKESGYSGHLGIEYEGTRLGEPEGIRATQALLERTWRQLSSPG